MNKPVPPVETAACPGCGQHGACAFVGERGVTRLLRCTQCGLVFADRSVWRDPHAVADYYGLDEKGALPRATCTLTHKDRIAFIQRWIRSGEALDYGGGLGETAVEADRSGFRVSVIEDSANAVAAGREYFPQVRWIRAQSIPRGTPAGSFDLIMSFHVLEHMLRPRDLLRDFHRLLRPGGCLCLEVPNWGSFMRRIRGMKWIYVLDHHVNQFSLETLRRTVEAEGFRFLGSECRRTFAINEAQPWKEPLKKIFCRLGFGDVLRAMWRKDGPSARPAGSGT